MYFKVIPLIIGLSLLVSCSLGPHKSGLKKRNLDQYYQSSGIVNYFLSELPDWANISKEGQCHRNIIVKYLHIKNMMDSFKLSYTQLLHFQYQFNRDYRRLEENFKKRNLLLKNEESLFYDVMDKIKSGIYSFRKPKFKRVNLIWIDHYLNSKNGHKKLKKLFKRKAMYVGHPVVISMCYDYLTIRKILEKNKLNKNSIRIIPAEMFSIFNSSGESNFYFSIDVRGLFSKKQLIYFYTPKGVAPKEIKGNFKLQKL